MEFMVIGIFIFIIAAWFSLVRDLRKEEKRRNALRKIIDDAL